MKWITTVFVATVAVGLFAGQAQAQEVCEQVRMLRTAGEFVEAEEAAGRCLESGSDDVEMMLELARAIYAQDRLQEALTWADRAADEAPEHVDAAAFSARLRAHNQDFQGAWSQIETLGPVARESSEIRRLEADLKLWAGDYENAVHRYTTYVQDHDDDVEAWTNLGHAQAMTGRTAVAEETYEQACELGSERGCLAVEAMNPEYIPRYFARVEPSYSIVGDRPHGQTLRLVVGGEPTAQTGLEVGTHLIRRGFVGGQTLQDIGVTVDGRWTSPDGARAGSGAGWTFARDFSPQWNVYVEGGWNTDIGLDAGMRLWRLQFPGGGANVVNPALTYYTGPWMFDGRYYLAINDEFDVDHSVLGRVGYFFGDNTSVRLGAGVGNRPDYMQFSPLTDVPTIGHYTGLVGGTLGIGQRQQLSLDLQYRHESNLGLASAPGGSEPYQSLDVMVGYTLFSW